MKRSGRSRGDRERVDAARRQAALALGRDPDQQVPVLEPQDADTALSATTGPASTPISQSIGVLTIGEAAARLGMSRAELEGMIARGLIEALPTGFTRMIPTSEIERLRKPRG